MGTIGATEDTRSAIEAWSTQWQQQALTSPCGSCTGRACTVCSVRTGGAQGESGMPSGYAPKVLEYYNSTGSSADTGGVSLSSLMLTPLTAQGIQQSPSPDHSDPSTDASTFPSLTPITATTTATFDTTVQNITPNAIVLENMKQRAPESEWLIDQGDRSIEGFAAQFSVIGGERVDFKINTDATDYRIDIYRIGYYNGDGARKVDTINQSLSTALIQPVPMFDPTMKLIDAGNWSVSASWPIINSIIRCLVSPATGNVATLREFFSTVTRSDNSNTSSR